MAAVDTSQTLKRAVDDGLLPPTFAFLEEPGARVYVRGPGDADAQWGMVWRPWAACGRESGRATALVPAFSVFAPDSRSPQDASLLAQIGRVHGPRRNEFLIEQVLYPLIDAHFGLIRICGLQGEWHSQNVLLALDDNWNCTAVVLRDMESIDRDLPFMRLAGRAAAPPGSPYKCIDRDHPYYAERHSFMFDHKLGEYLLQPLVDHACQEWRVEPRLFDDAVKDAVAAHTAVLPSDFFPANGCWYKYANTLIDQSVSARNYVELTPPRFRHTATHQLASEWP
jgi:hypothetical protein